MSYRLQADYRRRVTGQYLRLPLSWHQRHPTGQLLSNANSDVEATWFFVAPAALRLRRAGHDRHHRRSRCSSPTRCWPSSAWSSSRWSSSPTSLYSQVMSPRQQRAQQLRAEVSEIAHESFDAALVVKTLGREAAETERFGARADELRDGLVAVGRVRGLFDPLMEALPNLGTLAVLLIGAGRVADGATDAGDLVSIAYLFTLLALPIRAIGWVLADLPRALAGFDRVTPVLEATGETPVRPGRRGRRHRRRRGRRRPGRRLHLRRRRSRPTLARRHLRRRPPGATRRRGRARPARASPPWPGCWSGWSTRPTGRSCSTASTCAACARARSATRPPSSPRAPSSSTTPSAATSPSAAPYDRRRGAGRRCASPPPTTSSPPCPTGWTPASASAAPPCPAASGSGWRWPGPSSAGPGCWCWTTPPAPSTPPSRPGSSTRCATADAPGDRRGRRLPAGHDRAGRRGGLARARPGWSPAAATSELLARGAGLRRAGARLRPQADGLEPAGRDAIDTARDDRGPRAPSPRCAGACG